MKLRPAFWRRPPAEAVDDEIAQHIEALVARNVERGMDPESARRDALARFGDVHTISHECRQLAHSIDTNMRRSDWLNDLRSDIAFAGRVLRRSPLFTTVAVLTLAIGVGAATTVFSVVDAVLLRPLPYANAKHAVVLWNDMGKPGDHRFAIAAPEFADMRDQLTTLDVAALRWQGGNLGGDCGEAAETCNAERVSVYVTSPNLFEVLGTQPAMGRSFTAEDGAQGAEPVILISDALWRARFGRDPQILERRVTLGGTNRRIIGVMPPGVRFPDASVGFVKAQADLWMPWSWERGRAGERGNQNLAVVGRVHDGVSESAMRADVDRLAADFRTRFPDRYAKTTIAWRIGSPSLTSEMVGEVRRPLVLLLSAAGLVLLIACANVSNLALSRGASRQREFALRASLGAGSGRLARQLVTESVVLGAIGGALGIVLAYVAIRSLGSLDAAAVLPRADGIRMNTAVLAFACGISLVSAVIFGLVPAMQGSRADVHTTLQRGGRSARLGVGNRFRRTLVVAEVALTLVMLVGATLLTRSFAALRRVETGLDARSVMTFQVGPSGPRYDSLHKAVAYHRELRSRLEGLTGVELVSTGYPLPMGGEGWSGSYYMATEEPGRPEYHAEYATVSSGYFRSMGIPLLAGREFDATEAFGTPQAVIVDETTARRHWQTPRNAVGKLINPNNGPGRYATIVGVVGHVRNGGPRIEGEPQIYFATEQQGVWRTWYIVRTASTVEPSLLASAIRDAAKNIDPNVAVAQMRPMESIVAGATSRDRFSMYAIGVFAVAALILACVGLYGVIAYLVTQRLHEIGIRLALGGRPRDVVREIVMDGGRMAIVGIILGIAGAAVASRAMRGLLFGVREIDIPTFAGVSAVLAVVAIAAAYVPARRAARVDPLQTLRGS
jgi:putative ABC transport system permease protein